MSNRDAQDSLLPPMAWNAWGDPAAAKPLSAGIRNLLEQALGVTPTEVAAPGIDDVELASPALTGQHRDGLSSIVGATHVRVDHLDRILHAGGKSTPDLLRRKQIQQDSPDAVLLPGDEDEIAQILVQEGFSTVEEIAYVPTAELLAIDGFDEDIVEELRARARDALLTDALAVEEEIEDHKPADDLLAVDGMDEGLAYELAQHGIVTCENLADLATDELVELAIDGVDEARAAALIMAARGI